MEDILQRIPNSVMLRADWADTFRGIIIKGLQKDVSLVVDLVRIACDSLGSEELGGDPAVIAPTSCHVST